MKSESAKCFWQFPFIVLVINFKVFLLTNLITLNQLNFKWKLSRKFPSEWDLFSEKDYFLICLKKNPFQGGHFWTYFLTTVMTLNYILYDIISNI